VIGDLLLALGKPPQHETAWNRGAAGEIAVGSSLDTRTAQGPAIVLHDRRMPHRAGNIDHLAIGPSGVLVIDTKGFRGKVRVTTPWLAAPKLLVAGRDRTKLIDGLDRQVAAVREALTTTGVHAPVQGALCFTRADLPLLGTPTIRGHLLLYRKALAKQINAHGPLPPAAIEQLADTLAKQFPTA